MKRIILDGVSHPYTKGSIVNFDGVSNIIEEIEVIMVNGQPNMTAVTYKPVQVFFIKSSDVLKVESL